jgi:ABC-type protease/lipase transport system fused ATPase/permease subunit
VIVIVIVMYEQHVFSYADPVATFIMTMTTYTANTIRAKNAQRGIKQEWDKQMTMKSKQRAAELQASLALRDQILARQKQEAEREAEAATRKREQQLKYRHDLTAQLEMVHRRAFEEYASKWKQL